ncbi:lacticin 481 family lantibiotic [Staphylococcus sp. SQ8-PEA]|uniref:Lantibiotic n=1 Tax=Staphylococcus marylandisciuri TaxID=2981529 RepID=A0ABT2QR61_9STAP|nr:lacticin 481 family lantibiotic [Staphylococcus marylandisciuri]MCU5746466.1 lacticin 481 family lantibiotic [Staphylococcus marylandisciuri]
MKDSKIMRDSEVVSLLEEVQEDELNEILGAKKKKKRKSGVIPTVSHECHMNSFQFIFTCCS